MLRQGYVHVKGIREKPSGQFLCLQCPWVFVVTHPSFMSSDSSAKPQLSISAMFRGNLPHNPQSEQHLCVYLDCCREARNYYGKRGWSVCARVCWLKGHFWTMSACVCVCLHASNSLASLLCSKFCSHLTAFETEQKKNGEGWSDRQQSAADIWYSSWTDTKIELMDVHKSKAESTLLQASAGFAL